MISYLILLKKLILDSFLKLSKYLISKLFILLIKIYQYTLSPLLGKQCRFTPTCSSYSHDCFKKHGTIKGIYYTFRRILKCNPWGGSGYDPIPD